MARPYLSLEGVEGALEMLATSTLRLEDMRLAAPIVNQMLSVAYQRRWAAWDGWLYESGRLHDSFTDSFSNDAIRQAHWDAIEYGSSVPYARFHQGALLEVDAKMEIDMAEAMADYFEGARVIRGHYRAGSWVRPHVRGGVANPLSAVHG